MMLLALSKNTNSSEAGWADIDTAYAIYWLLNKYQNPNLNVLAISAQFGNRYLSSTTLFSLSYSLI